jgi:CheY-like chemotaxis protein
MAKTSEKLILVTDDEQDVADVIAEKLESMGYRTLKAYNGAECIEAARKSKPDLVFLDIKMPSMDGWEVASVMKNDGSLKDIPIIMLTGVELTLEDIMDRAHLIENYIMKSDATMRKLREAIEDAMSARSDAERILSMAGKSGVREEMLQELKARYMRKFTQYRNIKKLYNLYTLYGRDNSGQKDLLISCLKKGLEQQAEDLARLEKMLTMPEQAKKGGKKKSAT